MTSEQEIENIRSKASIIEVISSYIQLTPKGKNYFGVCPFHEDHSPSMSVSEEKGIYKCFSCGAAGNVFTFVKEYENVSFIEAVKTVANICGIQFHGKVKAPATKTNKLEFEIMELALKYYQNNLNTEVGKLAKKYLQERSLNEEVQKDFDIGLALDKTHNLHELLLNKKYPIETLVNIGLVNRDGANLIDVFQDRIIFPIHDLEGHPVGFTGRIYTNNSMAKYLNSRESVIFKKGQILFNYHRAKSYIKKEKEVIIVEGNMDAIRLYSSGIKNVVALMGTSLTKEQVQVIKNMRAKVILMFDNDEAGQTATFQNGNILCSYNINPLVVRLSGEKDPDEYIIKNGIQAIINNIKEPISFLDFKLKYLKKSKDLSKTEDLVKYIKELISSIKDTKDELTREITLKKISEEYDVPLDLLEMELKKITINSPPQKEGKIKQPKNKLSKYDIACINIIYFMMNEFCYIKKFKELLGYFYIKKYRDIANEIIYYGETHQDISLSSFLTYVETKDYIYDDVMNIIKIVNLHELIDSLFTDSINAAIIEQKKIEIKELKNEMNDELDPNKKMELANKIIELKKGCVGNE